MVLKNFYAFTKLSEVNNVLNFSISFNQDHIIYDGHFPDNPITPGVCLLHTGKQLLESYLKKEIKVDTILNVKFMNLIKPSDADEYEYIITILDKESSNKIKTKLLIQKSNKKYTSAHIIYEIKSNTTAKSKQNDTRN